MEKQNRNTRKLLQYLALFIALGTNIVRLVLYTTGYAYTISGAALAFSTYTAYGVAVAFIILSYVFSKREPNLIE